MFVIGGGAAVGKTTTARTVAARHGAVLVPVDAIWLALKAATTPASHPDLHHFDPTDEELFGLPAETLAERHIKSAQAISRAMDPVIEHYLWEQSPIVLEGAWITPAAAACWASEYEDVHTVFIHEPDVDELLAAMAARSGHQDPSPRQQVGVEVHWLFGNWVREQALAQGVPVVDALPRATLVERVLAALGLP